MDTRDPITDPDAYSKPSHKQFVADMLDAGLSPYHYRGRFYYEGPAVDADDDDEVQRVIRATSVLVQQDNMGLGWVIYPK